MQIPPLNALRAFHTVAQRGSLTAAAEELGVSRSAISHQIRHLEACIGLRLMTRRGRGVRLTEDGRTLAGGLEDGFLQIANAIERLHVPTSRETLRVTLPPIFASAWLVPRLDQFNAMRPEAEIVLIDSRDRVSVSSRDEIVIEWGLFADDEISFAERLSDREEIFPACSPESCPGPRLAGATLLVREVIGEGWNWPEWPTFLEAVGLADTEARLGPSLTARLLLDAARQGKGTILLSTTIARDDLAQGRLVRPVAQSLPVDEGYWILTARSARGRPEVRAFVSWLKQEFARDSGQVD